MWNFEKDIIEIPTNNIQNIQDNPLFQQIETNSDFFSDITPKETWLAKREQTIRERLIEKKLIEEEAPQEVINDFREHFNKTDEEILERADYQETVLYFENLLNKNDMQKLQDFLVMTYRNNLWYGISAERLLN